MINVAIVEDDLTACENLKECIRQFEIDRGESFNVSCFDDALAFLDSNVEKYEIVFMDIELPTINGMEAAKRLNAISSNVTLIFVTNMIQYAIKGYEVNAFDFILKPVKAHSFKIKMSRALENVKKQRGYKFIIKTDKGIITRNANEIKYVEVINHDLVYHLANGEQVATRCSLKTVQDELERAGFFKCNRCYLVNLRYVTAINDSMVQVGEDELQISRARKSEFLSAIADFFNFNKGN